jgi:hypothetical protein
MDKPTSQKQAAREHLRQLLEEGMRSELGPPVDKAWFEALRPTLAHGWSLCADTQTG